MTWPEPRRRAVRPRYIFSTRTRVAVTSTLTPSILRKKAMNDSMSSAENTPLILIVRSAGVSISMGVALCELIANMKRRS